MPKPKTNDNLTPKTTSGPPHDNYTDLVRYTKTHRNPHNIEPFEAVIKRSIFDRKNPTLAEKMGKKIL